MCWLSPERSSKTEKCSKNKEEAKPTSSKEQYWLTWWTLWARHRDTPSAGVAKTRRSQSATTLRENCKEGEFLCQRQISASLGTCPDDQKRTSPVKNAIFVCPVHLKPFPPGSTWPFSPFTSLLIDKCLRINVTFWNWKFTTLDNLFGSKDSRERLHLLISHTEYMRPNFLYVRLPSLHYLFFVSPSVLLPYPASSPPIRPRKWQRQRSWHS